MTRHVIARITVLCKIKESMPAKDSLVSGSPTPAHSNLPFNLRYQRPPPSVRLLASAPLFRCAPSDFDSWQNLYSIRVLNANGSTTL